VRPHEPFITALTRPDKRAAMNFYWAHVGKMEVGPICTAQGEIYVQYHRVCHLHSLYCSYNITIWRLGYCDVVVGNCIPYLLVSNACGSQGLCWSLH
jgi:hypothetical protein